MIKRSTLYLAFLVLLSCSGIVVSDNSAHVDLTILAANIPGTSEPGERGRDVEIVKAALEACGWHARFVYQPFGRHLRTYRDLPAVDAVMTAPLSYSASGYSTNAYIWYHNGAFYDSSKLDPIQAVEDLAGLRAVTFQNGIKILELADKQNDFELLLEVSDQTIHTRMLLMGRVDVILADGLVAATLAERIRSDKRLGERWHREDDAFSFAPIFKPTPYKMVFRREELALRFDDCFTQVNAEGRVADISDRYVGRYREVLLYRYLGL